MILLLLSRFSCVQLCATPQTAAHQTPLSLGFSRQEHWSVAISFSNAWKWKVKVKSLSRARLFVTPWTAAHQAPPSMEFSRQEYWSGVPSPSPKYLAQGPTNNKLYAWDLIWESLTPKAVLFMTPWSLLNTHRLLNWVSGALTFQDRILHLLIPGIL